MGISIGDSLAATFACVGALSALHYREKTGRGQVVDSAIYEAVLNMMESLITDFDTGLAGDAGIAPVTVDEVVATFNRNNAKLVDVLDRLVRLVPDHTNCSCHSALNGAQL